MESPDEEIVSEVGVRDLRPIEVRASGLAVTSGCVYAAPVFLWHMCALPFVLHWRLGVLVQLRAAEVMVNYVPTNVTKRCLSEAACSPVPVMCNSEAVLMVKGTMICADWEGTQASRRNSWSISDDANVNGTSQLMEAPEGFSMTE